MQPVPKGSTAEVGASMWARRWRAKQEARYGRLSILDDVSLAERQGQAVPFWDQVALEFGFLGPRKRDRF